MRTHKHAPAKSLARTPRALAAHTPRRPRAHPAHTCSSRVASDVTLRGEARRTVRAARAAGRYDNYQHLSRIPRRAAGAARRGAATPPTANTQTRKHATRVSPQKSLCVTARADECCSEVTARAELCRQRAPARDNAAGVLFDGCARVRGSCCEARACVRVRRALDAFLSCSIHSGTAPPSS